MTTPPKTALRTLGAPTAKRTAAPKRSKAGTDLADKAKKILRQEFKRALDLKAKLATEAGASGAAKGREANQAEKLRSIVASLEGMSRFALAMGVLAPAENRAIWADAMKKGLYEGWR
jgi:hypothetical protein